MDGNRGISVNHSHVAILRGRQGFPRANTRGITSDAFNERNTGRMEVRQSACAGKCCYRFLVTVLRLITHTVV
jgi:hypothetical protein